MGFNNFYKMRLHMNDIFEPIDFQEREDLLMFVPWTDDLSAFSMYRFNQNKKPLIYAATTNSIPDHYYKDRNYKKICSGNINSDVVKFTRHQFSVAFCSPYFDPSLTDDLFDVNDPFLMPNFEEQIKREILFERTNDDLTFDLIEKTEEEKKKEEEAFQQKIEKSIQQKKREFLSTLRQKENSWFSKRKDVRQLNHCSDALKQNGILVFVTIKEFLDDRIATILARDYDTFKIGRLPNTSFDSFGRIVIYAKRNANGILKKFEPAELEKINRIKQFRTQFSFEDIKTIDTIEKNLYKLPFSQADQIKDFRIGPITSEEFADFAQKSTVFSKLFQNINSNSFVEKPKPPMPLSSGITSLCLASGMTNGYLGTGPDQHLVKGSVYKKKGEPTIEEDPTTGHLITKENEYFHHTIKYVDRHGNFHQLL